MKLKTALYNKTNSISFWAVIIIVSLLPLFLVRFSVDLYLLPQIEIGITFFLSIYCRTRPWQFLIYGIFIDVAYGNSIGISSFMLLMVNYIIHKFKSNLSKQDIITIFIYYIFTVSIFVFFRHVIFCFRESYNDILHYKMLLVSLLINILYYPILHFILSNSAYLKNYENQ